MDPSTEKVAAVVVDAAVCVHRALGPGLLESVYQGCLEHELRRRGTEVRCEVPSTVPYGAIQIQSGFRLDMLVERCVVVENKAVAELHPVHIAQMLTYLKLTCVDIGLLINWNVPLIKDGIRRLARPR